MSGLRKSSLLFVKTIGQSMANASLGILPTLVVAVAAAMAGTAPLLAEQRGQRSDRTNWRPAGPGSSSLLGTSSRRTAALVTSRAGPPRSDGVLASARRARSADRAAPPPRLRRKRGSGR
jgi:hypothetical protein